MAGDRVPSEPAEWKQMQEHLASPAPGEKGRDGNTAPEKSLGWNTTRALVRRAKEGDRHARDELLGRYYDEWLSVYHGKLSAAVRRIYDTRALVHSAVIDVIGDLPDLQNEGAFFCWVTAIIRHKLANRHRRLRHEVPGLRGCEAVAEETPPANEKPDVVDDYIATLDAIIDLFPRHPGPMAAISLRLLNDCSIQEVIKRLQRPRRTVYRWLRKGLDLLRSRLRS